MTSKKPHLIDFPKIGKSELGFISVLENENLPFVPKRVYWTYYTPEDVERGAHSHYDLEQILIAVAGKIIVQTELITGEVQEFLLDSPNKGLYIPKMCWRTMKYTHNAVQICVASNVYDEKDYIRDYSEFQAKKC